MDLEIAWGRCLYRQRELAVSYQRRRTPSKEIDERKSDTQLQMILVSALSDSLSRIPTYPAGHFLPRRMFREDSAFNSTRIRWIQFIARTEILYFSSMEVELRAYIKPSGPNGRSDSLTYADIWLDRRSTMRHYYPNRWVLRTWGIGDLENLESW